jgi:hypothetical protein
MRNCWGLFPIMVAALCAAHYLGAAMRSALNLGAF